MSDSKLYLETLLSSHTSICFDGFNGKTFSFERLFHPFKIDEGKYAMQSHKALMDRAKEELSAAIENATIQETPVLTEKQKSALDVIDIVDNRAKKESNTAHYLAYLKRQSDFHDLLKVFDAQKRKQNSADKDASFSEPMPAINCEDDVSALNGQQRAASDVISIINRRKKNNSSNIDSHSDLTKTTETSADLKYKTIFDSELDKIVAERNLISESDCDKCSLVIDKNGIKSRVLAVASAGQGKTTLLKRIAVFYCHESLYAMDSREIENSVEHESIKDKYKLPVLQLLPCIIPLRSINSHFDIKAAINTAISDILRKGKKESVTDTDLSTCADKIYSKAINNDKFLLLIDGLDELSDSDRKEFLGHLDSYLSENPNVYVLMTSRVAGLNSKDEEVKKLLGKMKFRGRSIIPMSDAEIKAYSEKWIDETQPEAFRCSMKDALEQVLHQDKFAYLKEFMHTPLELLFVLKQIAGNTLSLDRYQMFADMLWEMFTNHELSTAKKQYVFEDYMTLLGFIAYKLQLKNKLSFSVAELEKYKDELKYLSFHDTDLGEDIVEGCENFFDKLASNVGIVDCDKHNNEKIYTFTIRSYHEFLTAYACCHLCLDEDEKRPNPQSIIDKHLSDSSWINIINFMLSDLYKHSNTTFDSCLEVIFGKTKNIELQKSVIEANHTIGYKHISKLCNNMFSGRYMDWRTRKFFVSCMDSSIASICYKHIISLYSKNESDGGYLDAAAIASVVNEEYPVIKAFSYLKNQTPTGEKDKLSICLGASMLNNIVKICFHEIEVREDKEKELSESLEIENIDEYAELLYNCAIDTKEPIVIETLTSLWLAKCITEDTAKKYLNEELFDILISDIRIMFLRYKLFKNPVHLTVLKNRLIILGSFPFNEKIAQKAGLIYFENEFINFISETYEIELSSSFSDCIAVAVADYYCTGNLDRLMCRWCVDICDYNRSYLLTEPSTKIIKNPSERVKNHFYLIKQSLWKYEDEYFKKQTKSQSTTDSSNNNGGTDKTIASNEGGAVLESETTTDDDSSDGN